MFTGDRQLSGVVSGFKRPYEGDDDASESDDVQSMTSDNGILRTDANCPHWIASMDWLGKWTMKEAVRELVANMIDQSRTVTTNLGLDASKIRIIEKAQMLIVLIGDRKLAEATWKVETCKLVSEFERTGVTKACMVVASDEVVKTQVIQLTNYDSALPWDSFFNGRSTKGDNNDVIGTHGEGLSGASVVLTRQGCNLSATCTSNNFTATVGALDNNVCFQVKYKKASTAANPRQPLNSVRFRIVLNPERDGLKMDIGALMATIRLPHAVSAAGIATPRGILLLANGYEGKQFNRSFFVADGENCLFGYDFHDPAKNLLQGRDRNSMKQERLLIECGAILSAAIFSSPEVCRKVLEAFKYPAGYEPGESKDKLKRFEDLRDGEHLTPTAVNALRRAELNFTAHTKQTVFCSHLPADLRAIVEHQGLRVVFTHPVLHNHESITSAFHGALTANAQTLSPSLRIGAHQKRIGELLGVSRVLHSRVAHASGQCTFWSKNDTLYITSPEQLGTASTIGFTETQEVALFNTLLACKAPEQSVVRIMRLLREGGECTKTSVGHSSSSFNSPAPQAASTGVTPSATSKSAAPTVEPASTGSNAKSALKLAAPSSNSTSTTKPVSATVRRDFSSQTNIIYTRPWSMQTLPVLTEHMGCQTEVSRVSVGTDPHMPVSVAAPPAPDVHPNATQTDFDDSAPAAAPRPDSGTYTRHAVSGVWLHGQNPQQQRDLAEVIEDSVQTEEGQRRLRRLSGQVYLVASVEQPEGLKKN